MNEDFKNQNNSDVNGSYYDDLRKKYSEQTNNAYTEENYGFAGEERPVKKKFVVKIEEEIVEKPYSKRAKSSFKKPNDIKSAAKQTLSYAKSFKLRKKSQAQGENPSVEEDFKLTFSKVARKLKISLTSLIIMFISLTLLLSVTLSAYLLSCANDILAIKSSTQIVTVTIPEGTSTGSAVKILKENGLIKHRFFCTVFAAVRGFGKTDYLNGIYYINGKMGLEGMLNQFKDEPQTQKTVQLTFPEGWTVAQIIDRLDEAEVCDKEILYKTLNEVSFDYDFLKDIPDEMGRYSKYEGYLYPDTYEFYIGENANSVFRRFFDNFEKKMLDSYKERAQELNISIDDVIKLASIIQKEAKDQKQMAGVSSVLHNRLYKYKADFPFLGFDSTLYYCTTYVVPNVDPLDKETYLNNYNTYICEGLPAGAICNPGIDAIYAALYPEDTNNCYFMHSTDGEIHYAKTLAQHEQNKIKYLYSNKNN